MPDASTSRRYEWEVKISGEPRRLRSERLEGVELEEFRYGHPLRTRRITLVVRRVIRQRRSIRVEDRESVDVGTAGGLFDDSGYFLFVTPELW